MTKKRKSNTVPNFYPSEKLAKYLRVSKYGNYLNLTVSSVENRETCGSGVVVGVNLYVQRQSLDTLLSAEVSRETLYCQTDFGWLLEGVPIDSQRVVRHLLDWASQTCNSGDGIALKLLP